MYVCLSRDRVERMSVHDAAEIGALLLASNEGLTWCRDDENAIKALKAVRAL